ncbi:MAG: hypothetical protein COW00_02060 [Bdellovibrio sp. CG12_big_fil_rev_8_21_14_0_65_39_13]|nr:MAG: hypothetical protein COW78_14320 [Bdellovibrio sp. CG22_combo_CG10-13_8_21_14_all_39_27]PIQ62166.1 MAG: hypothetical protein COW00_02060 [Bdellovibrio sp. CG12_big_fil_rev_8_21_14_0_65_39_13]PIR34178.1 MAG: hypothetical protein COV37_13810 [Bdellovibrio sp. CG11_big_fil_rev_8_21_14_0_20_39_38]
MIQAVGDLSPEHRELVSRVFLKQGLGIEFVAPEQLHEGRVISFEKKATTFLQQQGRAFSNWDLLFSVLGPNDTSGELEAKLEARINILQSLMRLKSRPMAREFHGSIRVRDLAASARFYTWLFGVEPKEWTHRYVTFSRADTHLNFVLLVADGKELHHDTLYHLGMGVDSKEQVIAFYHSAVENGFTIEKRPRTTWRGTPLHELWLHDPDGTLIEIYARLSSQEMQQMPDDKEPIFLV